MILLVLVAMAGLAFAARVVPTWDDVMKSDGRVHLYGVDPYFHLRHATSAAKHFPTRVVADEDELVRHGNVEEFSVHLVLFEDDCRCDVLGDPVR